MMSHIKFYFTAVIFCALSFYYGAIGTAFGESARIEKLVIEGNQRVEQETIRSYMLLGVGDNFDQEKIEFSIKQLFETGLFENVVISREGNKLLVEVHENPVINQVVFEGNKRLKKEDLEVELLLKPRSTFTKTKLQQDTKRIIDLYRKSGRFSATVTPKLIDLGQNRLNVVFEVKEGPKTPIKKLVFIGNHHVNDRVLESLIQTKAARWYRFFSGADTYDSERLDYDKELLRRYYTSIGYADMRVISAVAELTPKQDGFILTFVLEEGTKYRFGEIKLESTLPNTQTAHLYRLVETKKGKTFNAEQIEHTIEAFTKMFSEQGFAFVDVEPVFEKEANNQLINIRYIIKEGQKVYVNRINIKGNVRTEDKVIRREFRLAEGDPYNAAQIRRTEQRIRNLGFFDKVDLTNQRTDYDDKVDINVDVSERSTGEVNFGAGFSTTDGALASIGIRERNLLGKGQDLRFDVQRAQKRTDIDLSFTEPYFLGYDMSAGIDLFNITRDRETESSFNSETNGGVLRLGYDITEYLRHQIRYSYKEDNITDVAETASRYIKDQAGSNTLSLLGHSLIYDKRDNRFRPTEGYLLRLNQEFAGLGGDAKFIRHELRGGVYMPLTDNHKVVLQLGGNIGNIVALADREVRISERFFIGGEDLRGFRNAGIGPRDLVTKDALGGNNYYTGTVELEFPLGLPEELGFTGALFMDAGTLFDTDSKGQDIADQNSLRLSVGGGIAWGSPLGPVRIDAGIPIVKEDYDRTQLVRFSFGTKF